MREIILILLVFTAIQLFGFSPSYRDEFLLVNKTEQSIVVVFDNIGLIGPKLDDSVELNYQNKIVRLNFDGNVNEPNKHFRTVKPGEEYFIGHVGHESDLFDSLIPKEKFNLLFKKILIFNDNGDLLYNIHDFNIWKIESVPGYTIGVLQLVIE